MAKRDPQSSNDRHQLTVRISKAVNTRLEACAMVLDRTYRDIVEDALEQYLKGLKLTPEQKRKVSVLVGD